MVTLGELAAQRTGTVPPKPPGNFQGVGMMGSVSPISMGPQGQPPPQGVAASPGAPVANQPSAGITPGAIERRMETPPGLQFSQNRGQMQNAPNMVGPARSQLSAPVTNIQTLLEKLQQNREL
jgi:hypothetical protein